MNIKNVLLITVLFSSCNSVDDDFLGINDVSEECTNIINDIINDNSDCYSQLGLSLKSSSTIHCKDLSLADFFNKENPCYPAYGSFGSNLQLLDWNCFQSDTFLIHVNASHLTQYVDSILNDRNDYIIKELTWEYGQKRFSTIALFDSYTGDLVYDNILFNTFNIQAENNSINRYLTRGEGNLASAREFASFGVADMLATCTFDWRIEGGNYVTYHYLENGDSSSITFFEPDMPIIGDAILNVPSGFPNANDVSVIFQEVYSYSCTVPGNRPFYTVRFGIGYPGLNVEIPTDTTRNESNVYGYAYAYKSYFDIQ